MCGYMDNRIKWLAKKEKLAALDSQDENANVLSDNEPEKTYDDETNQELVDKMKSLVIDENNLDGVKADLRATRDFRDRMLLNKRTDLLESYPYFFTNASLV